MTQASPTPRQARLARAWETLAALTVGAIREERDFTVTGLLKWVIEPIMYTAVYFILVAAILRRQEPAFLLFLMCGLLPFRYFSGVLGSGLTLVSRHSSVLVNRSFPRSVLPLATLGSEGVSFLVSLVLLAPLMAFYGIAPTWALLWLPVIVVVLGVLTAGGAYVTTVFGLYFPDFRSVAQNLIRVSYFMSTGLVRVALDSEQQRPGRGVPGEELPRLLKANPLSGVFDSIRDVIIRGRPPRAADVLYPLAVGAGLLVVGVALYRWREPHFAKEV